MGNIRMGVDKDLVLFLKKITNYNCFIETGTFYGSTSIWAADFFKRVVTIENSEVIYNEVKEYFKEKPQITALFGNSRDLLTEIDNEKLSHSIFWLDAHWCGENSYGEDDQCPLIEELNCIKDRFRDPIIMIDDARLFTSSPPKPNNYKAYPNIDEITSIDKSLSTYIFEDVIYLIPEPFKEQFESFLHHRNSDKATKAYELNSSKWRQIKYKIAEILQILRK